MRASKAAKLSRLFRSGAKAKTTNPKPSLSNEDSTLLHFISSVDFTDRSKPTAKISNDPKNKIESNTSTSAEPDSPPQVEDKSSPSTPGFEETPESALSMTTSRISSLLFEAQSIRKPNGKIVLDSHDTAALMSTLEKPLEIPWFSNMTGDNLSMQRKEVSRDRKKTLIYKGSQETRFRKLIKHCADKLGTDATLEVFHNLRRDTGVKEYNALIGICIDKAKASNDEEGTLQQIDKMFYLLESMKERGFRLEEESYHPILMYLIDTEMVEEFRMFFGVIKDDNPNSVSRLGYYEMMLWLKINNEEKIQDLCNNALSDNGTDCSKLRESYLLALCESDRKKEILLLLKIMDITKLSSGKVERLFKALGRLLMESYAEEYLFALKGCDDGTKNISNFIFSYVVSIPNLAVEDVISKFKALHSNLEVSPLSSSYEKLILFCCKLGKVHAALDVLDEMFEAGLTLSVEVLNTVLRAIEDAYEYNLVHRVYSMICHQNLESNDETYRSMINMSMKMKDFHNAYKMLDDMKKRKLTPTSSMYNAIMTGYFRVKDNNSGVAVLKQMEDADVKPDSTTYSYLISNCETEEDIIKYYEEMKQHGVQPTKQVFMSLIDAYAACGQSEKAKQVVLDKEVPIKHVNEIKSLLVSALASHGKMSEALLIYEELKQAGYSPDRKAVMSLIEYFQQSDRKVERLLQLLQDLSDPNHWIEGCWRVILHCVHCKHLSAAFDLILQLKDKFNCNEEAMEILLDEVFFMIAESDLANLQMGLELLQFIKKELDVLPSRKSLDSLLSACANARDLHASQLVWKEYEAAGLPYNVLTFLRMYQALLASGEQTSAKLLLKKIPRDDPHVVFIIKACRATYTGKKRKEK